MNEIKKIFKTKKKLVEQIREYVRSQKELWRQIPYLALQADGRGSFSDVYTRAYNVGVWPLEASIKDGYYQVMIDLATGELISSFYLYEYKKLANAHPDLILPLINGIDELDANKIIFELKQKIKNKEDGTKNRKITQIKKWREKTKIKLKIKKKYERPKSSKRKIRK